MKSVENRWVRSRDSHSAPALCTRKEVQLGSGALFMNSEGILEGTYVCTRAYLSLCRGVCVYVRLLMRPTLVCLLSRVRVPAHLCAYILSRISGRALVLFEKIVRVPPVGFFPEVVSPTRALRARTSECVRAHQPGDDDAPMMRLNSVDSASLRRVEGERKFFMTYQDDRRL